MVDTTSQNKQRLGDILWGKETIPLATYFTLHDSTSHPPQHTPLSPLCNIIAGRVDILDIYSFTVCRYVGNANIYYISRIIFRLKYALIIIPEACILIKYTGLPNPLHRYPLTLPHSYRLHSTLFLHLHCQDTVRAG